MLSSPDGLWQNGRKAVGPARRRLLSDASEDA